MVPCHYFCLNFLTYLIFNKLTTFIYFNIFCLVYVINENQKRDLKENQTTYTKD